MYLSPSSVFANTSFSIVPVSSTGGIAPGTPDSSACAPADFSASSFEQHMQYWKEVSRRKALGKGFPQQNFGTNFRPADLIRVFND